MNNLEEHAAGDDIGVGPGTDLAFALVGFLMVLLALGTAARQEEQSRAGRGQFELRTIRRSQEELVHALARHYRTTPVVTAPDTYAIATDDEAGGAPAITIQSDVTLQHLSFGSHVLFESDSVELRAGGHGVLSVLCGVMAPKIQTIREVHVGGHADTLPSKTYPSNLQLAAARAITVYQELRSCGLDPTRTIMSATSFGEFVPIGRLVSDRHYSSGKLAADNDSADKRRLNRRIALVLVYRHENDRDKPTTVFGDPTTAQTPRTPAAPSSAASR